jgi:arsenate reductase-like glutaredoxin family protein
MEVQIFGVKKSADTRKALRFFSERRIKTHFVDLIERAASLSELRRFAERFGLDALIDRESRAYASLGLRYANMSEERWLEKLVEEPLMLTMPLVRQMGQGAKGLTIGFADEEWRRWAATPAADTR